MLFFIVSLAGLAGFVVYQRCMQIWDDRGMIVHSNVSGVVELEKLLLADQYCIGNPATNFPRQVTRLFSSYGASRRTPSAPPDVLQIAAISETTRRIAFFGIATSEDGIIDGITGSPGYPCGRKLKIVFAAGAAGGNPRILDILDVEWHIEWDRMTGKPIKVTVEKK